MRILFLESHPMWIYGLPNGFRDLGHRVECVSPRKREAAEELIRKFRPQIIMVIGWTPDNSTQEKQLQIRKLIRNTGIPVIYWATEDPGYTFDFSLPLIRRVKPNFIFTICRPRINLYKRLGYRSAKLDFGYHPSVHAKGKPVNKYRSEIALIANAYPKLYREQPDHLRFQWMKDCINTVLENKWDLNIYGRHWNQMKGIFSRPIPKSAIHGYLPYEEAHKVYNSTDIMIGLQNKRNQLTQRTYEILGSGGFMLTSDTPAIKRYFTPGKDLVTAGSKEEMQRVIKYYLNHPAERKAIQLQGQTTIRKHMYKFRAKEILQVLKREGIITADV
ncbi:CgeB family protein [Paenibacillus sp. Dod16]|uniref:CgeB family protein n=1 Tax=Paenibacillus TaxID=44249 RepID=UPI00188A82FF|nr:MULTISPECIES: glycosyltransferase [Paenibacillus]MBX4146802.1 glycosyltransferase [Paenibacillus lautus]